MEDQCETRDTILTIHWKGRQETLLLQRQASNKKLRVRRTIANQALQTKDTLKNAKEINEIRMSKKPPNNTISVVTIIIEVSL